jgi:organic hydroperoxide reductase OsmC/OhrA
MSEHQDPPVYRAHLSFDHGYRFDVSFDGHADTPPLRLDEPPPLGDGQGPNAAAVLGAAVADCLSASLLFCLRKAHVEVDGLEADAAVHVARNDAGRLRVTQIDVALAPVLAGDGASRFERCAALFEDFCPVTQGVREGITVNVAVRPAGGGTAPDPRSA